MTEQRIHPPFSQPTSGRRAPQSMQASAPASAPTDNLPSIEQYVDDLPSITEFLLDDSSRIPAPFAGPDVPGRRDPPGAGRVELDEEGWAAADWQSYDWNGLAGLGAAPGAAAAAQAAWSSTDWDSADAGLRETVSETRRRGGIEVAEALDDIAQRIRSGELSLEQFRGLPPEAAIAAVFAAFLRSRG